MGNTVQEGVSTVTEKISKGPNVREIVIAVAGPREFSDTRETWLRRAARRAGISYRQAKALWYGEITDPHHRSARLLQDAATKRAHELAGKFEHVARSMVTTDPDFYSADVLALISVARRLRGEDSSGDSGNGTGS
jgi:hypothetical protein